MKEKRKPTERAGLKFFACLLAAVSLTVSFFSGILTVICLQNNVYLDGGEEFLQNEVYDLAYRSSRDFASGIRSVTVSPEDGTFILGGADGSPMDPVSPDGNLLMVINDSDGNVVATTGESPSSHLYGYRKVVSGSSAVFSTQLPDRRTDVTRESVYSVAEADDRLYGDDVRRELAFEGVEATLTVKVDISEVFGGGSYFATVLYITPDGEVKYSPAMKTFSEAKVGDSFSASELGLNDMGAAYYPDNSEQTEEQAAVMTEDPADFIRFEADDGDAVLPNTNESRIIASRTYQSVPFNDGKFPATMIINGYDNLLHYGDESYPLGSEETSLKVQEIMDSRPLSLESRVKLLNAVDSGFGRISSIYFEGSSIASETREYFIDVYADLTPEVVNSSYLTLNSVALISRFSVLFPIILAAGVLTFLICSGFLAVSAGRRHGEDGIVLGWFDKIPFEIILAALVFSAVLAVFQSYTFFAYRHVMTRIYAQRILEVAACAGIVVLFSMTAPAALYTLSARLKAKKFWKYTVVGFVFGLIKKILGAVLYFFSKLSTVWKMLLIVSGYGAVFIIGLSMQRSRLGMFICIAAIVSATVLALMWSIGFERLREYVLKIRGGNLGAVIDRKYLFGSQKSYADALEGLGEGVKTAVDERMRSERLKTELITNVSHDLKTPLTSIVNYVDILSKDDIQDENAKEHVEVLKRQAARMKKLIEDLVEVSKASSGNVPVNPERTDVNLLLTQCVAEYSEKFEASGLEPVVKIPEEKILSNLDGRLMWRVLDNLLGNACKYALAGTRFYVTAEDRGDTALLSFKNVSRVPLDMAGEDLVERFVRGDSSRNTEGSGLGLSIAKSLCDLQGVGFELVIDGDLFKAELTVKKCGDEEILNDAPEPDEEKTDDPQSAEEG